MRLLEASRYLDSERGREIVSPSVFFFPSRNYLWKKPALSAHIMRLVSKYLLLPPGAWSNYYFCAVFQTESYLLGWIILFSRSSIHYLF